MTNADRYYLHYLEDILEAIQKILKYTEGLDFQQFKENEMVADAVVRNFEIVGEAANQIPDHVKEKYPEIRWRGMIGLRNFVIHEYFGIDYETLWTIISENLQGDKVNIEFVIEAEKSQ